MFKHVYRYFMALYTIKDERNTNAPVKCSDEPVSFEPSGLGLVSHPEPENRNNDYNKWQ